MYSTIDTKAIKSDQHALKILKNYTIVPNSNMYKHVKYAQAIGFMYACTYQIG